MGYSKEQERQNEVLKDLLSGKEHIKKYVPFNQWNIATFSSHQSK